MFTGSAIRTFAAVVMGFCLTAAGASGLSQAKVRIPRAQKHNYEREVEKLEAEWRQAQLSGNVSVMERLLAEDYTGINSQGLVVTKQEQLERVRTRKAVLTRLEVSDMKVKLRGTTAIVTSKVNAEGTNDGAPMDGMYRYTRVYSRMPNGSWKIVNFESTRIPKPGSAPLPHPKTP